MPSSSPRLGLPRPLNGETFIGRAGWSTIFDQLDAFPGIYPCLRANRPTTWGVAHTGMHIVETDFMLVWVWNGTIFTRARPLGLLGSAEIATTASTAASAPVVAASVVVAVPATTVGSTAKRVRATATWKTLDNGDATNGGMSYILLRRQPGGVVIRKMDWFGRPSAEVDPAKRGGGGTIVGLDLPPVAGASHTYELCIHADAVVGGTTYLRCSAADPVQLFVEEIGT